MNERPRARGGLAAPEAAAQLELVRLHVVVERVAGKEASTTHVFDGNVCRIGSHASNDLVLDDKTISRFHCRIAREGHAWRLTDVGSRNGTRLDGVNCAAFSRGPSPCSRAVLGRSIHARRE